MEAKEQEKEKNGTAGNKRKSIADLLQKQGDKSPSAKKAKTAGYQLEPEIADLIEKDVLNAKLWAECKECLGDTKQVLQDIAHLFSVEANT